jgi:hypothetical protein
MLAADTYESLTDQLTDAFKGRYPKGSTVQVCGLLFMRPSSKFAANELLPHIEYFDNNSADHIDFFCVGYESYPLKGDLPSECIIVAQNSDSRWSFSPSKFVLFKEGMESDNKWYYSGGCDLLLLNARFDPKKDRAELDFETVIPVDLEDAVTDKAIKSVERFFELVVRLTKNLSSDDPTYALSDYLAIEFGKKEVVNVLRKVLPYGLGDIASKCQHFAIR